MATGRDFQSAQLGGTAAAQSASFLAISANVTAPADTDTVLTGEITTVGGGLLRAAATYGHSAGGSNYTLTKTFTANGSDTLPVTIGKVAAFNASSAGTMFTETLVSPTATLSASGDAVTITETVSI